MYHIIESHALNLKMIREKTPKNCDQLIGLVMGKQEYFQCWPNWALEL